MFNSNIPAAALLSIEGSGPGAHTPKTPEILNSVIAMTNPLDNFNFNVSNNCGQVSGPFVSIRNLCGNANGQSHSQDSSHSSCSASPLDSPAGAATTPSVQQTCSQLIKAGLKLSIQSKRKLSTCDSSSGSEQPNSKCSRRDEDCEESSDEDSETKSVPKGLTPEDEDRRRRRRERNKIAATKCRMKKRERTQNLIKESEVLDTQNVDLKNQVRALETDRQRLLGMLNLHTPGCVKRGGWQLPAKLLQSPAYKYLAELKLDGLLNGDQQQRMQSIPSMSTFKFNSKTPAAMAQQLPNGYCKPSPSPQEFEHAGYLSSPTQEALCLPQQQQQQQQQQLQQQQQQVSLNPASNSSSNADSLVVSQQVSDYVPNCEGLSLGLGLSAVAVAITTPTNSTSSNSSLSSNSSNNSNSNSHNNNSSCNNNNNSATAATAVTTLPPATTPTSAIEFVKNELVDSQGPYITPLSAQRFLFEPDGFPDIKHAVSVHPTSLNNMTSVASLAAHNNNNHHLIDFHNGLPHAVGGIMTPCYEDEQLLVMKNNCFPSDLLSHLPDDEADFVDLDTGSANFMTNGGCLA
ncbi:uncharacterized protein Dmoj_GI21781 [Drosophila mojavensis]|uniref:BZIP domain-containing protein n=1 Tax=Drosophila mojavensis TaxID=7230 RepID=B4L5R2_DROMO|nr:uncharacterized protein Dmoj_GI21781 [Drosophila mojavensis]